MEPMTLWYVAVPQPIMVPHVLINDILPFLNLKFDFESVASFLCYILEALNDGLIGE
jgi:hypothetical protein